MGGIGSGTAHRKPITLICQWEECKEEFIGRRKDAKFCSQSCRDACAARNKMIKTAELIKCRICNKSISIFDALYHLKQEHRDTYSKLYK